MASKPIRTHTFNGMSYDITYAEMPDGFCAAPNQNRGEIYISDRLKGRALLETEIHEALHAIRWRWTEALVTHIAAELARWLWRLGYRKC